MKKFILKKNLLPIRIKRFEDISAEPLFVCQKRKSKIFSLPEKRNEFVCRKWSRKNLIKILLIALPLTSILILTGGLCVSVKEKLVPDSPKDINIKKGFFKDEEYNKNYLLVVNSKTPIPKNYKPNLIHYMQIECDVVLSENLDKLLNEAKSLGYELRLSKGYVPENVINENYNKKLNKFLNEGFTIVRAEAYAERLVSSPGKSEYQTGLLVDIYSPNKNEIEFLSSDAYKWLVNNCVNYGFIQRYPSDKVDKTGKDCNPYCFRFVGKYHAYKMRTLSMCLEEYSDYIKSK